MVSIGGLMNTTLKTIKHACTVQQAVHMMREERIGALFVEKDGDYVGIVTERDIVWKAAAMKLDFDTTTVEDIMNTPLLTLDANESTSVALDLMLDKLNRYLAVTENGKIVGMTSSRDILAYLRQIGEGQPKGETWQSLLGR